LGTPIDLRKTSWIKTSLNVIQALAVFIIMFVLMSVLFPSFHTYLNLTNILKQQVPNLLVSIGMTFILITAEIDISVGGTMVLVSVLTAEVMASNGIYMGILVGLSTGAVIGVINGLFVVKGKIPSFIATLGMMYMTRSVAYVITKGFSIPVPIQFQQLFAANFHNIPYVFFFVIVLYIVAFVVLTRTVFGKHVYATGINIKAAELSGISVAAVKLKTFVLTGFLAGMAGIILISRLGAVEPNLGTGFEFSIISAVIIGGTSLFGGSGNVFQSILGVFIIALIKNGLNLGHVNLFWQDFVTGAVIIVAVLIDTWRKNVVEKLS
jgi:ribose/xylose/arabinose/galactoside ABC-type transport system permease subunit